MEWERTGARGVMEIGKGLRTGVELGDIGKRYGIIGVGAAIISSFSTCIFCLLFFLLYYCLLAVFYYYFSLFIFILL